MYLFKIKNNESHCHFYVGFFFGERRIVEIDVKRTKNVVR